MKKALIWLLCICLTTGLWACALPLETDDGTVTFYYCRPEPDYSSPDAVIAPEFRNLGSEPMELDAFLQAYLAGPADKTLESPFPRDTGIRSWNQDGDTLYIDFTRELGRLSGIELTIACACIGQTLLNRSGAQMIVISADGELLNGEPSVIMTREKLHLADDSLNRMVYRHTVYYTDASRRYLIPHEVSVNLTAQEAPGDELISQLLATPSKQGLYSPLPAGTRLQSITVEDGLCTVDFSVEFESNAPTRPEAQRLALMSVVNTLTCLDGIDRVEFSIDGNLILHYGLLTISEPLHRDEGMIGPVRTAVNEFDATLYLANGAESLLLPVPTRIRQTSGSTPAELTLLRLLELSEGNGLRTGIPAGTQLNAITIRGGVCVIELSEEFLSDPESIPLAARVIAATMCEMKGISAVRIQVNGAPDAGELAQWFGLLSTQSDWFL